MVGNFGNRDAFTAVLGHFCLRMRGVSTIYASDSKSVITIVLIDADFLFIKGRKFWRCDNVSDNFYHISTTHAQKQSCWYNRYKRQIYDSAVS